MGGDPLKQVLHGDPVRRDAETFNRTMQAVADAVQSGAGPPVQVCPAMSLPEGVRWGLNDAGANATRGTVVEISTASGQLEGDGLVTFGKPGDYGTEIYGVTLCPVPAGEVTPVALTGGPWTLAVTGTVAVGDNLSPRSDGTAEVGDGPLQALSADADSYCWAVFAAGGGVGTHDSPASVGTTAETEAAQTDTWDRDSQGSNDGVEFTVLCRQAYDSSGDETLYGYYRTVTYDSLGNLATISAETRVTIDTPGLC